MLVPTLLVGILFVSIGLSFFISSILDKQERLIAGALDNDAGVMLPGKCGLSQRDWRVVISLGTCVFLGCLGTVVFAFAEHWSLTKSIYYVCISITTVGYGDAHVMNPGTKIFAVFWLGFSTLSLGKAVSDLIDWKLSSKILAIRNRVLNKKIDPTLFKIIDGVSRWWWLCFVQSVLKLWTFHCQQ